jgi:FkbM family methyltransferase
MVSIRGFAWGMRNISVNYRYFENWYILPFIPSIGVLREYGMRFRFDTIKDLAYDSYVLRENFFDGQYDFLDVKNKVVLDIGANIGDTALLFAYKGAKKVIAYEPYLYQYNRAEENIRLNNMQDKIILKREAIGMENKKMTLSDGYTNGSQTLSETADGIETKQTTLSEVIRQYHPDIIKSDCEGSEYDIFLNTPIEELKELKQISIDYHRRGFDALSKCLISAGFNVKTKQYDANSSSGIIWTS